MFAFTTFLYDLRFLYDQKCQVSRFGVRTQVFFFSDNFTIYRWNAEIYRQTVIPHVTDHTEDVPKFSKYNIKLKNSSARRGSPLTLPLATDAPGSHAIYRPHILKSGRSTAFCAKLLGTSGWYLFPLFIHCQCERLYCYCVCSRLMYTIKIT